jgi:hypothetical protein
VGVGDDAGVGGEMIACVDCGYQSKWGNKHWDYCRLILLQWIHIEGRGKGFCEFKKLDADELADLQGMEKAMEERGAKRGDDGYFGDCFIPELRGKR